MSQSLAADARNAYAAIRDGGLVLLPTDVGYGLIACHETAVARIYALKGRPAAKPCVTVATLEIQSELAPITEPKLRAWVQETSAYSPLAIVNRLNPESELLAGLSPFVRGQATTNGTVATFHNAGELVTRIARMALADGLLVIGSSANTSGTGNNVTFDDVPETMRDHADWAIDHGPVRYAAPSRLATTIFDLTTFEFRRVGVHHPQIAASWSAHRRTLPTVTARVA